MNKADVLRVAGEPFLWFDVETYAISRVEHTRPTYEPLYTETQLRAAAREGAKDMKGQCANWLRRNASAEKDPSKRAVFIEAHNAILALPVTQANPEGETE